MEESTNALPRFTSYDEYLRGEELRNGCVRIDAGIDEETTAVWLAELAKLGREPERKEIDLIITSPGGGAYHAFALYDALRRLSNRGIKVRAWVEGIAASAASMIVLQAADERAAAPHARFLLHEARRWVFAAMERASDLEDEMAEMRALTEQITEILGKRCGKTREEVTAMITRKELWLSAREALKLGLIDAIVD